MIVDNHRWAIDLFRLMSEHLEGAEVLEYLETG